MKFTSGLLAIVVVLVGLSVPGAKSCGPKISEVFNKKVLASSTTQKPVSKVSAELARDEAVYAKYAKYASN